MRSKRAAKGRHPGALPALALLLALAALTAPAIGAEKPGCTSVASIGVAQMTSDGEITLRLHSLPPGPIAEGMFRYRPGDPQYEDIKKHLGGIAPGESKPVPPWC